MEILKATVSSDMEYAGFWRRFAAYIIDYILAFIMSFIIAFIFGFMVVMEGGGVSEAEDVGFIIGIVIFWLYWAVMESSPKQATLGKMALGIMVTDLKGNKISFGRATGRHFGKIISGLILLIGFIMVGFTRKKQGLHDIIAECLVVSSLKKEEKKINPDPKEFSFFEKANEVKDNGVSMNQSQSSTLKSRLLKLPLLIIVMFMGTLIFYAIMPSAMERDLNIKPSIILDWSMYTSLNNNFSVLLPADPKIESYTIPINDNENIAIEKYTVETKDEYFFAISISNIPKSLIIHDSEIALLDTLDGMVKSHSDNKLESYEMFTLSDLPAVRFVIKGKTTTWWSRGIAVINGDKKYIVQFYNKGDFNQEIYSKFINSFKIN